LDRFNLGIQDQLFVPPSKATSKAYIVYLCRL
jgi:hypothetical protein